MADVARRARLAKGTLYLYFPTKEALLLDLLEIRLGRGLSFLESSFEGEDQPADPDRAARLIASALLSDEALIRLLMILGAILEHNLPEQRIREFKSWLNSQLTRTGATLERCLPFLATQGGVRLLLHLQALVTGLGQLARPALAVARVLESPEFSALRLDFETELPTALAALMRGFARAPAVVRSRGPEIHIGEDHDN